MKLNNRGWGLGVFLGFLAMFIFCIMVAGINSYRLGLSLENNNIYFDETVENNNESNKKSLESRIISASMNYKRNNYSNMSNGQTVIVKISKLKDNNYISSSDGCSGYVEIKNNNGDENYNVYLKCDNYITEGYNSEFDD